MTLRQYLFALIIETIVSAALTVYIVFTLDPYQIGTFGHTLFYVSLFLSCLGLFSLLGFGARFFTAYDQTAAFRFVRRASVHAVFLAISIIALGVLLASRLVTPILTMSIAGALLILEIISILRSRGAEGTR